MQTFKQYIAESKEDHPHYAQAHELRKLVHASVPDKTKHFDSIFNHRMKKSPTAARDYARDVVSGNKNLADLKNNDAPETRGRPRVNSKPEASTEKRGRGRPKTPESSTPYKGNLSDRPDASRSSAPKPGAPRPKEYELSADDEKKVRHVEPTNPARDVANKRGPKGPMADWHKEKVRDGVRKWHEKMGHELKDPNAEKGSEAAPKEPGKRGRPRTTERPARPNVRGIATSVSTDAEERKRQIIRLGKPKIASHADEPRPEPERDTTRLRQPSGRGKYSPPKKLGTTTDLTPATPKPATEGGAEKMSKYKAPKWAIHAVLNRK